MTWRASVLTLFPEMFPGPLGHSLAGRAQQEQIWSLDVTDIRIFGTGKHRKVDGVVPASSPSASICSGVAPETFTSTPLTCVICGCSPSVPV